MADNPSLGITQADANAITRPNASLDKLLAVWSQDVRYSGLVDMIRETRDNLTFIRQEVINYIAVEGT
jgi:hypothetical protein